MAAGPPLRFTPARGLPALCALAALLAGCAGAPPGTEVEPDPAPAERRARIHI